LLFGGFRTSWRQDRILEHAAEGGQFLTKNDYRLI
jgi:hypothetical protein